MSQKKTSTKRSGGARSRKKAGQGEVAPKGPANDKPPRKKRPKAKKPGTATRADSKAKDAGEQTMPRRAASSSGRAGASSKRAKSAGKRTRARVMDEKQAAPKPRKSLEPARQAAERASSIPPDPTLAGRREVGQRRDPGREVGQRRDPEAGRREGEPERERKAAHEGERSTDVDPEVAAQIRALEARLGGMIERTSADDDQPPPSFREQVTFAAREVVDRLSAPVERPGQDDGGVVDAVRGLLSSDYYLRQWGRLGMRNRSEEVDDFGLDPVYERRLQPLWDFLYKRYFRVQAQGAQNIPNTGRCLIVANHSGTIPLDGLMLRTCLRLEHPSGRELRWLAEDFVYHLPFVGAFMSRVGAVRACQENAQRLLRKESLVAVFPEGVKGIGKLYRDRYQLQRFGRGGFIRLCLRMGAPIVPCAVIGAEESSPMLYRDELLSRAIGLPYLPITPTFPWLGPAGLIPAPTKWRIAFGEAMDFSEYGPSAAEDNVLVGRLAEGVRATIQRMLDHALSERRSVWTG